VWSVGIPPSLTVVLTVRVNPPPSTSDGLRLVSGDAVELDVRVARLGSRALARLVDLVAQAMLAGLLAILNVIVLTTIGPASDEALAGALTVVDLVLVLIGYPVLLESLTGGRTLGKLVLGLRVIRDDGGPVRFRHALTRALIGVAIEFPALGMVVLLPLGWLISLWTMLVNPHGKRLGDLAAGTVVIHDRTPQSWGWVPAMPPQLAGWASLLDLTGLDDDLALAVRHYLARNRQLREPARSRLGHALASEVAAGTTPPAPPGTPGWAYLAAVLAERNRRAAHQLARARVATGRVWPELHAAVDRPAPAPVASAVAGPLALRSATPAPPG
jgi:uncharacterized RDD family membrane protein YckC